MTALPHLTSLVASLEALGAGDVSLDVVSDLLSRADIPEAEARRFVQFADDHYTRHKVFRNELFDVLFLCWQPGQVTPVHNHNGQLGWVRVLRGSLQEVGYRTPTGDPQADLINIEIDDDMVGHGIDLTEVHRVVVPAGRDVATVDRVRQIHSLGNPRETSGGEPAVSLHVYSRPHDSCLTIDVAAKTCRRKELRYDTAPEWRVQEA